MQSRHSTIDKKSSVPQEHMVARIMATVVARLVTTTLSNPHDSRTPAYRDIAVGAQGAIDAVDADVDRGDAGMIDRLDATWTSGFDENCGIRRCAADDEKARLARSVR
jgi:hypothetical protein